MITPRCTVAHLMGEIGLQGAVRGRRFKTTVTDEMADRSLDLVERDFQASRPDELWVSDVTYYRCGIMKLRPMRYTAQIWMGMSLSMDTGMATTMWRLADS